MNFEISHTRLCCAYQIQMQLKFFFKRMLNEIGKSLPLTTEVFTNQYVQYYPKFVLNYV